MYKIYKRKTTEDEAKLLIQEIKLTPNIVGYSLREWLKAEHTIIAEDETGKLLGACLNYDFSENWTKISALFVLEEFRSQGIGKSLFYKSFEDAIERQKNIYSISSNPIVINFMSQLEFTTFSSLIDFPKYFQKYQSVIYLDSLKWLMSSYRIQEIIRKKIVYPSKKSFIYGFKSFPEKEVK